MNSLCDVGSYRHGVRHGRGAVADSRRYLTVSRICISTMHAVDSHIDSVRECYSVCQVTMRVFVQVCVICRCKCTDCSFHTFHRCPTSLEVQSTSFEIKPIPRLSPTVTACCHRTVLEPRIFNVFVTYRR